MVGMAPETIGLINNVINGFSQRLRGVLDLFPADDRHVRDSDTGCSCSLLRQLSRQYVRLRVQVNHPTRYAPLGLGSGEHIVQLTIRTSSAGQPVDGVQVESESERIWTCSVAGAGDAVKYSRTTTTRRWSGRTKVEETRLVSLDVEYPAELTDFLDEVLAALTACAPKSA